MKRMVQFAAVVVVALLACLPTAEVLTCPLRAEAASAACPMSRSAECPFAQGMTASKCLRDCCNCGLPKLVGPIAVRLDSKLGMRVQLVALAALSAEADLTVAAAPDGAITFSSPPRYILNRVFRI